MVNSDKVVVEGDRLARADRDSVYTIVSDSARMPKHVPRVARAMQVLSREGDVLPIEAEAASFGRLFPSVRVLMIAELLPGKGYRCSTHNLTFNTWGDEQLLLLDAPKGTRIQYTYSVTVLMPASNHWTGEWWRVILVRDVIVLPEHQREGRSTRPRALVRPLRLHRETKRRPGARSGVLQEVARQEARR